MIEKSYCFYNKWLYNIYRWWYDRNLKRIQSVFNKSNTRYYGDGGTIHNTKHLDVEVHNGKVVSVWFRCQTLPFKTTIVDADRAVAMTRFYYSKNLPEIRGVELKDDTNLR